MDLKVLKSSEHHIHTEPLYQMEDMLMIFVSMENLLLSQMVPMGLKLFTSEDHMTPLRMLHIMIQVDQPEQFQLLIIIRRLQTMMMV